MIMVIERFGRYWINKLSNLGLAGLFIISVVFRPFRLKRLIPLAIKEIYNLGVLSLFIMIISALFIGFVVGLQGYNTLDKFGSSAQLGQLLALSIVRELGPVLTALLFVGRAGSSLTAEIGLD